MAHDSGYVSMKLKNEARLSEEKRIEERKKNVMILCLDHLRTHGYLESLARLETESGVSLQRWEAADNVDLLTVVQEFEAYYEMRFGKKPRLARKGAGADAGGAGAGAGRGRVRSGSGAASGAGSRSGLPPKGSSSSLDAPAGMVSVGKERMVQGVREAASVGAASGPSGAARRPPSAKGTAKASSAGKERTTPRDDGSSSLGLGVEGTANQLKTRSNKAAKEGSSSHDDRPVTPPEHYFERRLLKPLPPDFYLDSERKQLAETITRDIYLDTPDVRWDDIAGLDKAKRLLKEAVVMPLRYPQLFTGLLSPWKGILLFGPPGTGKTMLAKAVATECQTTFFNISASSIVSKWRGDSEKLVRVLFELARHYAPSTVFMDEIDSLMGQRDSEGEHEGSRRMKTELLIQMDGLARSDDRVFVLAASNLPWDLDSALLRRLEKRILVDLPNKEARQRMLEHYLPAERAQGLDHTKLANATEGYSGSDIRLVCKESAMRPLRKLMEKLEDVEPSTVDESQLTIEPVTMADVLSSLETTKPSAKQFKDKYDKWQEQFGSV